MLNEITKIWSDLDEIYSNLDERAQKVYDAESKARRLNSWLERHHRLVEASKTSLLHRDIATTYNDYETQLVPLAEIIKDKEPVAILIKQRNLDTMIKPLFYKTLEACNNSADETFEKIKAHYLSLLFEGDTSAEHQKQLERFERLTSLLNNARNVHLGASQSATFEPQ